MSTRRLLLIDDNDDYRARVAAFLQARGWDVDIAHSMKQGLELAAARQPHVIITELLLPDVRGYQFARSLRSMVEHDIRVVALTRLAETLLHDRARQAGFDHVLVKPAGETELATYIDS